MVDVTKIANKLTHRAMVFLKEDGYLTPVSFVLLPSQELEIIELDLKNAETRERSTQALWAFAQMRGALAVVTLMDGRPHPVDCHEERRKDGPGTNPGGESQKHDPKAMGSIVVQILRPAQSPTIITVPYQRVSGRIVYDRVMVTTDTLEERLIPPWRAGGTH